MANFAASNTQFGEPVRHQLMDGKVQLYRRIGSPSWHCACSIGRRQIRANTKEAGLARAAAIARDWYLALISAARHASAPESLAAQMALAASKGGSPPSPSFRDAATRFIEEFETLTRGQRSPIYVKGHHHRLKNHLIPFFGDTPVADITAGMVQDYRVRRMGALRQGSPPGRSTLHQEIVCLRQVLKAAARQGWINHLPDLSAPYAGNGKVVHRAWFSAEDFRRFDAALQNRMEHPRHARWRRAAAALRDYVHILVHTGLRPDEALRLEFRDVAIVADDATGERLLEIAVRGKRGVGWCKSMPEAVAPFRRLTARNKAGPEGRLFPTFERRLFNALLEELNLKTDREGQRRTAYSLRHTYISTRLMNGADIYQVAKNCRTSVDMIEIYYASHIKNVIDASAINVRKTAPASNPKSDDAGRIPDVSAGRTRPDAAKG